MTRPYLLAAALLTTLAGSALGQITKEDVLKAHSNTASSKRGGSTMDDLIDWRDYNLAGWRAINKGRYDTAEHEFYSAIKAARRPSLSAEGPRLMARSYADYAWAIQKQGRHAEAEPLARWVLEAREATFEPDAPPVSQSLNQLAALYYELGRFNEAEPLLKRAVETQGTALKPNHQEHARSHTLMGLLLIAQRRYAESERYFLKAIQVREKSLGSSHPETGDALNNLAWSYHEQGKDDDARPLFERALRIFEQSRGPSDTSVAHVLHGLAKIHVKEGENEEAEAKFLRAIEIWDQRGPDGSAGLIEVLKHYSGLLEKLGRAEDLVKIKARLAPLRAKFAKNEVKVGAWYRFPDPSQTINTAPTRQRS